MGLIKSIRRLVIVDAIIRNVCYYTTKILGINRLGEYENIYRDMRLKYESSDKKTGKFWQKHRVNFHKEIVGKGLKNFKKESYISFHYSDVFDYYALKSAIWQYYNHTKKKDYLNLFDKLSDLDIGNTENFVIIEGKKINWVLVENIDNFYNVINFTKWKLNEDVIICEVGGGYGELARIFLEVMPKVKYVLVDLPDSLFLSYYYLYEKFKDRVTFCLPHEIKQVQKADCYINIYSFAEMLPENIIEYFNEFERMGGKFFYSRNRLVEHNVVDKINLNLIDYLPKNWIIKNKNISQPWPDMIDLHIHIMK